CSNAAHAPRVAIASGPLFRRALSRSAVAATYRSNSMSVVTRFKSMATAADTFVSGEARLQTGGFPALRERDQRPFELVVVGSIRQDFRKRQADHHEIFTWTRRDRSNLAFAVIQASAR